MLGEETWGERSEGGSEDRHGTVLVPKRVKKRKRENRGGVVAWCVFFFLPTWVADR